MNYNRASLVQQKAGQLKTNYLYDCNLSKGWGRGAHCGMQEDVSTEWLAVGVNGHWSLWAPFSMVPLGLGPKKGSQASALPSSQCAPVAPYRRFHGVSALPLGSPAPWPSWKRTKPTLPEAARLGWGCREKPTMISAHSNTNNENSDNELKTYAMPDRLRILCLIFTASLLGK